MTSAALWWLKALLCFFFIAFPGTAVGELTFFLCPACGLGELPTLLSTNVSLNGFLFHTGQTITFQADVSSDSTTFRANIYLWAELPGDGTVLSLVRSGDHIMKVVGPARVPYLENVLLTQMTVPFVYPFNGNEPVGTYITHASITLPGSNQILVDSVRQFQFSP